MEECWVDWESLFSEATGSDVRDASGSDASGEFGVLFSVLLLKDISSKS